MAKIPFDIKFRSQIESGEYTVESRDGMPVRIVCWDRDSNTPICALYRKNMREEFGWVSKDGHYMNTESTYDLFVITPDPELSEYESAVRDCITTNLTTTNQGADGTITSTVSIDDDTAKNLAAELLELAKEEIKRDATNARSTIEYKIGFRDGMEAEKKAHVDESERWRPNPIHIEALKSAIYSMGLRSSTHGHLEKLLKELEIIAKMPDHD